MPRTPQKSKPESRTAALTRKAIQKVVDTWNEWGAMDSGWQVCLELQISYTKPRIWSLRIVQKRVYEFGQRAQARIEFEELALRSIDPTLGPRLGSSRGGTGILGELDHRVLQIAFHASKRNNAEHESSPCRELYHYYTHPPFVILCKTILLPIYRSICHIMGRNIIDGFGYMLGYHLSRYHSPSSR